MSDIVDPKWAGRIRAGDRRALVRQFSHEAFELRRITLESPEGVYLPWADFRRFLADVGPSPGPAYRLTPLHPTAATPYRPAAVSWKRKTMVVEAVEVVAPRPPRSTYSQWTMIAGRPVQYGELPHRLGVPFTAISAALHGGCGLDELVARLDEARSEVADLSWFSASLAHQQAFRSAFLSWRLRVRAGSATMATAKFLYLFTLLPAMAECRAALVGAGCWHPRTLQARDLRDAHAAWKRFSELRPKAEEVLEGFDIYRQYSLIDDIDELNERVIAAERRFRSDEPTLKTAAAVMVA